MEELKKLLGDAPKDEDAELLKMLENRGKQTASPGSSDADATQRVSISPTGRVAPTPPQRKYPPAEKPSQTPEPRSKAHDSDRKKKKKKKEQALVITLICIAAALLIAIIIVSVSLFSSPEDDHLIFSNTYAAGIHLGGMTKEQAKTAIQQATDNTYSKQDMTVTVLDTTITLSPADTGAKLDVDAIVEAAYSRGRDGSPVGQKATEYHIPILPYLNLDTDYIRSEVNKLGAKYSTTLSQTRYEITGTAPSLDIENKDTSVVYQTLYIHIGTAEYGLSTDKLYDQIMEAYNSNLFQVTGECSVVPPDDLNYDEIYAQYCTAPVDAVFNPDNYEVTPEIYGYGFDLAAMKLLVSGADYGSIVEIPLTLIRPNQTAEDLSGDTFRDVLSTFRTELSDNANYNRNLLLAGSALNNLILRPGEVFSFNEIIGQPTTAKGYKSARIYVGKDMVDVIGGGISQVASTLYCCALLANLDILERVNHAYVPEFCEPGTDADINYGTFDLRFMNTTTQPIRIQTQATDEYLEITLIGTDNNDYRVEIEYEVVKTYEPNNMLLTLPLDNPGGYKAGDILVEAICGYSISTYRCTYDKATNELMLRDLLTQSFYEKRNQVVVDIVIPVIPDPTIPSDPSNPSGSSDPSGSTVPSGSSAPTESTSAVNPSTATQPSGSTTPTGSTAPTSGTAPSSGNNKNNK